MIQTICLYFLLTKDIIKYCLRISLTHNSIEIHIFMYLYAYQKKNSNS